MSMTKSQTEEIKKQINKKNLMKFWKLSFTDKEIARKIGIHVNTLKSYMRNKGLKRPEHLPIKYRKGGVILTVILKEKGTYDVINTEIDWNSEKTRKLIKQAKQSGLKLIGYGAGGGDFAADH